MSDTPRRGRPRKSDPAISPAAYSVSQFCEAHNISEAFYYRLRRAGLGPRVMRVGARTLISHEAAARWRRDREAAPPLTPGSA